MLSYTVYSEAGGVGKTTLASNLAVAHGRAGLDVLVVPLDPQDGDLSRLLGVDDDRADSNVDNLVRHLIDKPRGPFNELIRSAEGVDVVPEHNILSDLDDFLQREQDRAEDLGDAYNIYSQLHRVLREADVGEDYDILICDPPASEGLALYNAIYATRNLVIPVEPSWKGRASVEGLEQLAMNFADQLNIDVGVLAAIPNGVKNTTDQREMVEEIDLPMPEVIGDRTALFEASWKHQCSAFEFIRDHRNPRRDYEIETLAQIDRIARFLEAEGGVEAPNPPDPGALDREVTL